MTNIHVALAVAALLFQQANALASDMAPGFWEYHMQTQVEGVPFRLPAVRIPACLDADDVKYGVVGVDFDQKGGCHFDALRQDGDKTRYQMVCPSNPGTHGEFEFSSTAEIVNGAGVIKSNGSIIRQEWSGKRLRDC